ncbi:ergothioneine biosynthesis protein EgtB [Brumimicrobium mesophilum]|uniref:ergothioneine biosynthesis protein EgtB n=1 Tax=Brumimicrobium mesophilum TaxID=392717 RepID=UPI000D140412|nr:ergothioneine biosynthesis protein EgtB [Brumimicrobium mesophilum]
MNIIEKFKATRDYTEKLCEPLEIEDYGVQIATFTSPTKWHIAHTTWFFEEFILKNFQKGYTHFDDDFNFIFNSYYNNSGKRIDRANRGYLTRPTVKRIFEYRKYVTAAIVGLLENDPNEKVLELLELGINHEEQHQELLITDLKFMFASNPLQPVYDSNFKLNNSKNEESGFASVKEGVYEVGHKGKDFCYDNELGVHKVYLNDFEISKSLVTNEEYIEFMEAGGYEDFNLWLEEGLHWKKKNNINCPLYWEKVHNVWHQFTLSGLQKVDPKAILAHISYYEASAFAEWKKMRLPTEFEWEIASEKFDWGKRWEWTNSSYLAYPNFKKSEGAVGEYNGKFMDKQKVLRGASVATSKNHSRNTYRNFFYSEERWQFTGLRLVK